LKRTLLGTQLLVDGTDTGEFEVIPAGKDPINCRIYNVTCRLYDPYLRPILFDQRGNKLMEDKSSEIDYDPRDGFTVHKCGDIVTTFKCTAQAFGNLEQKEYTRKRNKISVKSLIFRLQMSLLYSFSFPNRIQTLV